MTTEGESSGMSALRALKSRFSMGNGGNGDGPSAKERPAKRPKVAAKATAAPLSKGLQSVISFSRVEQQEAEEGNKENSTSDGSRVLVPDVAGEAGEDDEVTILGSLEANDAEADSEEPTEVVVDLEEEPPPRRSVHKVAFSLGKLKRRLEKRQKLEENAQDSEKASYRKFLSKIAPSDNASAEAELSRHIDKADFLSMKPLGQFNLGFIIASRGADLFIVDQHASDEKFNFERLSKARLLEGQGRGIARQTGCELKI